MAVNKEKGTEVVFTEFLDRVASRAGLKIAERGPVSVTLLFSMEGGRSQKVWVTALGKDPDGNLIVGFFSPVLQIPAGAMLGQKSANELLRDNAHLSHGAWAIQKVRDEEFLVAYDTQIAQTMDPAEFKASVCALAAIADAKEKELGQDVF